MALLYETSEHQPPTLLLNPLHAIPLPSQILLPQTDFVVAATDREDVAAETPAYPPQHGVEVQDDRIPVVRVRGVRGPYPHRLVLGCGRDVGFLEDGGRPGHVADPVGVAGQEHCGGVLLIRGAKVGAIGISTCSCEERGGC